MTLKMKKTVKYIEIHSELIPLSLLLEADPSESKVRSSLENSLCFAAVEGEEIVGASVVKFLTEDCAEILNMSVWPSHQGKGIGSALLDFVLFELKEHNFKRVELGTGCFGYQLTYYQRAGFRVDSVAKDYFLDHYSEPIFEQGIQHKDMLRLYLDL